MQMKKRQKINIGTTGIDVVKALVSLPAHGAMAMLESTEELESKRIKEMAQKDVIGSL
jgi:hypothetical protein